MPYSRREKKVGKGTAQPKWSKIPGSNSSNPKTTSDKWADNKGTSKVKQGNMHPKWDKHEVRGSATGGKTGMSQEKEIGLNSLLK